MSEFIPFRVKVRKLLKALLPQQLFSFVSRLWVLCFARFFNVQGTVEKYTEQFVSTYPKVVQGGPFIGMKYVDVAVGSNYLHKLIGSYEAVLHPAIVGLQTTALDTIIDIGSAEGYYLIGLGRMFPQARLVGFELEESGRNLTEEMYRKNNLQNNLTLLGEATAENITPYITPDTFLLCDCEGAEMDILDPERNPQLKNVKQAIVELHDQFRPGITVALTKRFEATHNISFVIFAFANPHDFPYLESIKNESERYDLLRERGIQDQQWMILTRK